MTIETIECSICLENIKSKTKIEPCNHEFCFKCISRWSIKNYLCPLCRTFYVNILRKNICYENRKFQRTSEYIRRHILYKLGRFIIYIKLIHLRYELHNPSYDDNYTAAQQLALFNDLNEKINSRFAYKTTFLLDYFYKNRSQKQHFWCKVKRIANGMIVDIIRKRGITDKVELKDKILNYINDNINDIEYFYIRKQCTNLLYQIVNCH